MIPLVIDSSPPSIVNSLKEIWQRRELLEILARRDLAVRYKQTLLGIVWVVLQPALTMIVFSIVFGRLAGIPSDGLPYPVFVLCGLVPWQLFSFALTHASNSLIENERLITKVYFPRILIPLATTLVGLVDFAIAFALLILACLAYGVPLGPGVLAAPLLALLCLVAALACGLWLAALNVEFRDVRYVLPFVVQIAMYVSPVAYPTSLVPAGWRWLYGLNPMAGIIDTFRWALIGGPSPDSAIVISSFVVAFAALLLAVVFFERRQRSFADTL
jgi:lipopolysaccharide transport system permease protein